LNKMEVDRSKFESVRASFLCCSLVVPHIWELNLHSLQEQMLAVEAAYKASWDAAVEKLPASIDRLMCASLRG
jgi:hypothetical protein